MPQRISSTTLDKDTCKYLEKIVAEYYDLGQMIRVEQSDLGYINVSYELVMLAGGVKEQYLLRRYRAGSHENKIKFEHALLRELHKRRFTLTPGLIETKQGHTYLEVDDLFGASQNAYLALFTYLPGEDRYSWDQPLCTAEELRGAAEVLALYHNTILGWEGIGEWQGERIIDKIPLMIEKWKRHARNPADSSFDSHFLREVFFLTNILGKSRYAPVRSVYDGLPHLAIHGDFHPGNLRFSHGQISGVFDFDWSEMDSRCFDVGLALMYFCSSWENNSNGDLLLDRIETFLESYQEGARAMDALGPLSPAELQYLPRMILAANACIIDWTLDDYYEFRPDPDEYLRYLRHGVNLMKWLETNWTKLNRLVEKHGGRRKITSRPRIGPGARYKSPPPSEL
jgi:homoserine kinase type II